MMILYDCIPTFTRMFQLQDILKFGVDKLFEDKDSSIEDTDLEQMLGPTVNGQWQAEDTQTQVPHLQSLRTNKIDY